MTDAPAPLLLAEDLDDDVFIMRRALKKACINNPLQVVRDGNELIAYLTGTGKYHDRSTFPLPFLVFLDLMMPYRDGFELLAWMQKNSISRSIPVVVLTSSSQERDQALAYKLGARSYLVKPPQPQALLDIASSLNSFFVPIWGQSPFIISARALHS